MTAIEFKNVTFKYENSLEAVLQNADMKVNYGEVTLLTGNSGAGKSTVLSLITGIIPEIISGEISGEILIDGENISGRSLSSICRKVGVVLQNADSQIIYPTVEDEIAFGCENFAFRKEDITAAIEHSCSLTQLEKSWETRKLSGGQKQRLITACNMACGRRILILDEPLANLDTAGTVLLMEILREKADQGYAVLIIEHRIDRVIGYVDCMMKIEDKKIISADLSSSEDHIIAYKNDRQVSSEEDVYSLNNVGLILGGREILRDISLNIKKGERILFLGENGCGKTSLLRILARLQKPTSRSFSHCLEGNMKKWFSKVGVVYQNPDYQLFMSTVSDEVAFNAKDREYAQRMLEIFGLSGLADRHPQSLSEGQKRRVTIAAVMAGMPEVLLLDEPTVGQDITWLESMVSILNKLHEETGNTMITVTHDKRCASALCDRAYVIKEGSIINELKSEEATSYLENM